MVDDVDDVGHYRTSGSDFKVGERVSDCTEDTLFLLNNHKQEQMRR